MAQPNPAQTIWPHLAKGEVERVEQVREQASPLAQAMYPRKQTRPSNPYREILLRSLRELNADLRRRGSR